jgi:hypothetical protein
MRNSQRAVILALGFIAAVMIAFGMWVRIVAEPVPELSGRTTSRTYDLTGFGGVDTSGQWRITIERGDAWSVAVEVPAELVDDVEAEVRDDVLHLRLERGWCIGCARGDLELRATITMPSLESIDTSGASVIAFSGFDGSTLSVDLSGAGELRGTASRFDRLVLDMSGAARIDLAEVPVTDAEVDISGAGNVQLRMAGGRLTGDMSGAANLEYSGSVSDVSIDRSGMVNVRQRD